MSPTEPVPLSISSSFYQTLHDTALRFVHSLDEYDHPSRLDINQIRAVRTSDYTQSWGHNYFTSTRPHLRGAHGLDRFIEHMQKMIPLLESWHTDVSDVVVDEAKKMVIVRASYWMKIKGEAHVENDLIWWLCMDESGEKVKRGIEFLDAEATGRIAELMMKREHSGNQQ